MAEDFGTYQLHEKVAQGGMAEVFVATEQGAGEIGEPLAIKRMFSHLVDQEDVTNMFIDEARIASRLDHPNIVEIYDLGVVDGTFFIAMEYVEGLDLRRACERGVAEDNFMSRTLAVDIIARVASALEYAHGRVDENGRPMNIIHRDVSPQNVLLSIDGGVKLCDFGIAKAESRLTQTRFGELKGKFSYMSPEQFQKGDLDHRSDIFTLGILLYETTVRTRLFRAESEYEAMRQVTNGDFEAPREVRADYPADLEAIVLKALAVDLDERYRSAGALRRDLEEWLERRDQPFGPRPLARFVRALMDEPVSEPGTTDEMSVSSLSEPPPESGSGPEEATAEMTVSEDEFDELEEAADGDATVDMTVSDGEIEEETNEIDDTPDLDAIRDETISEDAIADATVPDVERPPGLASGSESSESRQQRPESSTVRDQTTETPEPGADDFEGEKTVVSSPEPGEETDPLSDRPLNADEAPPSPAGAASSEAGIAGEKDDFEELETNVVGPETGTNTPEPAGDGPAEREGDGGAEDDFEQLKTNVVGGGPAEAPGSPPDSGPFDRSDGERSVPERPEDVEPAVAADGEETRVESPGPPGLDESSEDRTMVESPDPAGVEETPEPEEPGEGGGDPGGSTLDGVPDLRAGGRELTGIEDLPPGSPTVDENRGDETDDSWSDGGLSPWIAVVAVALIVGVVAGVGTWLVVADDGAESTDDAGEAAIRVASSEPVSEGTTTLELQTRPEGARVVANGAVVDGETPMEIPLVRGEKNALAVFKEGRRPVRRLVEAQGTSMEREIELKRAPITDTVGVDFRSTPSGARVFVDGRPVGETPMRLENLAAGFEHHVQFDREGRRSQVVFADVSGREEVSIDVELAADGSDEVTGRYRIRPAGSRVAMGGEMLGETFFKMRHRSGDWLALEVTGDDRQTDQRRLRLDRIGGFEFDTELAETAESTGLVTLEAEAPTAVFVDGRPLGHAPIREAEIPTGNRSMVFETTDGRRFESAVDVESNRHHRYRVEFGDEGATLGSIEE